MGRESRRRRRRLSPHCSCTARHPQSAIYRRSQSAIYRRSQSAIYRPSRLLALVAVSAFTTSSGSQRNYLWFIAEPNYLWFIQAYITLNNSFSGADAGADPAAEPNCLWSIQAYTPLNNSFSGADAGADPAAQPVRGERKFLFVYGHES